MTILVFGGHGLLGSDLIPVLETRGHRVVAPSRGEADVTDREAVQKAVEAAARGDAASGSEAASGTGATSETLAWVVNLAAYTAVDGAEREPERAFAVNREGAENVATAARRAGSRLLHLSTDYVFDGRRGAPYPPDAHPSPLNVYGRSKLEGEEAVAGAGGRWLIVRTSWLYGAGGRDFVDGVLERGRKGEPVEVVTDQRGRPTWTRSLARTLTLLIEAEAQGIFHAADGGEASWWEMAAEAFRLEGLEPGPAPVDSARFRSAARRPGYSVLDTSRTEAVLGESPPHWKEALASYLGHAPEPDHSNEEATA
jgi:dTDP-4-dehydrorhamnose reductase